MVAIVGFLIGLLTFPGVIVHEFAHKKACDWIGVPVVAVAYFRLGNPPGYVEHGQPDRYRESFAISVAPFFVNTIAAFALLLGFAFLQTTTDGIAAADARLAAATGVCLWLGLSVGIHAFPSTGDANTLWNRSRTEWRASPIVLAGIPIVVLIYLANVLSRFYLDVLYAIGLAVLAFGVVDALAIG